MISDHFYPSNLLPAAPVNHCYRDCWIRDMYYMGLCSDEWTRRRLWGGMIDILDRYRWKLEIHAHKPPVYLYEHIHIKYSSAGKELTEPWAHNQWDSIGNWIEVCIDEERLDLADLLVSYLAQVKFWKRPAAGAWEDRNSCDAYSLVACIQGLQRAKPFLPQRSKEIEEMVKRASRRLYGALLPFATTDKMVCLSLLGIIWPYNMAGPYRQEIINLVQRHLMKEPFGFIRYHGDSYDGEYFSRTTGNEVPWLLGDAFMALIEPDNPLWLKRLDRAYETFGCLPEAYKPESMQPNRNTPLLWAEAMYDLARRK